MASLPLNLNKILTKFSNIGYWQPWYQHLADIVISRRHKTYKTKRYQSWNEEHVKKYPNWPRENKETLIIMIKNNKEKKP